MESEIIITIITVISVRRRCCEKPTEHRYRSPTLGTRLGNPKTNASGILWFKVCIKYNIYYMTRSRRRRVKHVNRPLKLCRGEQTSCSLGIFSNVYVSGYGLSEIYTTRRYSKIFDHRYRHKSLFWTDTEKQNSKRSVLSNTYFTNYITNN